MGRGDARIPHGPRANPGVRPTPATDHTREAYLWSTTGSMLNAFQSVFMLMVITRVCDMATAGVFTLAYANANLFLNLGNYGMRAFEASDAEPRYGFRAYLRARMMTGTAMVLASWAFLAWSALGVGYDMPKVLACVLIGLFKGVDTVEDVFDGNFQREGRLDVGGRQLTLRVGTSLLVFVGVLVATGSLAAAAGVGFAWSLGLLAASLVHIRRVHGLPAWHAEAEVQSVLPLLRECLPLAIAAFLLFYVGNAPKYAIDAALSDEAQAIYGFIAMPVFVVGLLAQFVYMPMVEPLSHQWANKNRAAYVRTFLRQVGVVAAITVVCVVGAALVGPPVLGWLYNTDLAPYRLELCLLVLGGGFLALASLFTMGITIMRRQELLVWGYAVVATLATLASGPLVRTWGILGASLCYIGCMVALAAYFAALFFRCAVTPSHE